jgi:hypothetical protein
MQSETRSADSVSPTWDDNWMLLRRLWPEWSPTEEQSRELWWRAFDKPHGIKGEGKVDQKSLHDAICDVARASKWKEPKFLEVADQYKRVRNVRLAELDRLSMAKATDYEAQECDREHSDRLRQISNWSATRLEAAQTLVARRLPTFTAKSPEPSTWSRTYSGLLLAADEEIRDA